MIPSQAIEDYCRSIGELFHPLKVILFGSYAYGEPDQDSDVDVMVMLPRNQWPGPRPSLEIRRQLHSGFPVDILVRDPGEVDSLLREGHSFLQEIMERGRVIYEASHE